MRGVSGGPTGPTSRAPLLVGWSRENEPPGTAGPFPSGRTHGPGAGRRRPETPCSPRETSCGLGGLSAPLSPLNTLRSAASSLLEKWIQSFLQPQGQDELSAHPEAGTLPCETSPLSSSRTPFFTDGEREAGWPTLAGWMVDCPHRAPHPLSTAGHSHKVRQPSRTLTQKADLIDLPHELVGILSPWQCSLLNTGTHLDRLAEEESHYFICK